ncbi:MAG: hypothetical protein JXQ73_06245 [Phycisphaerae bacterium]|nr:hypothetical protein [Phycisphaerae bacterium]
MCRSVSWVGWVAFVSYCSAAPANVIYLTELVAWHDSFNDVTQWQVRPDWLPHPDASANVTTDGKAARFAVKTPDKGMKWSRDIPSTPIAQAPFLYLRYCATDLKTEGEDYLVYVNDGVDGTQCSPVRLCDAIADGQWRIVAVDLRGISRGKAVSQVAIQVQAGPSGQAKLWVDEVGLAEEPPRGAVLLRGKPGAQERPDLAIDVSSVTWTAQPSWLANPTDRCRILKSQDGGVTTFRVEQADHGMKWHAAFAQPLDLTGHRYLAMRYRAARLGPYPDYALCFLGRSGDGSAYEEVVKGVDLQADGRFRTVVVPLDRAAARIPKADGMAVQVQADGAPAELQIASVRLVSRRPSTDFADLVPYRPTAQFGDHKTIDLTAVCNQSLAPLLEGLRLTGWPESAEITTSDVPFRLRRDVPALAGTGIDAKTELAIPVGCRASQVFLLMLAVMRGEEDAVYGGGAFRRIDDVDRFRLRLTYENGTVDECLPANVTTGRFEVTKGVQVLCAQADPSMTLRTLTLCDVTPHAGFAVAAITCRTSVKRLLPDLNEARPPTPVKRWDRPPTTRPVTVEEGPDQSLLWLSNGLLKVGIDPRGGLGAFELWDQAAGRQLVAPDRAVPLAALMLDGKPLAAGQMRPVRVTSVQGLRSGAPLEMVVDILPRQGVQLHASLEFTPQGALRFRGKLVNGSNTPCRVGITWPQVGPYVLGDDLAMNEYVYPCRAARIGRDDASLSTRYSGLFGVQFMATVNPRAGQGLYLRTEDTTCSERSYVLVKDAVGMLLAVRYPERAIAPGQTRPLADTLIAVSDGDWHAALEDYRRWIRTWYRSASPRKPWFREVFNFRQRFLHWLDPLYDAKTGKIDLPRAVSEAREKFGGIDYLHLFDWGNCGPHGRIYGRVGDYDPYDFIKGGRRSLHDAIAAIRTSGIPVGLYIEGYLLDERGKLGQAHGKDWQLLRPDGTGARWPGSSEIYVCPGVTAWREVQAQTYAAKVRELGVDGMYIDQFGFTGTDKDCYSDKHGHPVPSYPVQTEIDTTRAIRQAVDAVKPGVSIYAEESPTDVTSQYQDGAFTYEMNQIHARRAEIPINLFRFAVPDLKTFEILICDKPTSSWATGIRWTFFNGEGIWLEGPADEWFAPETLATIRKCHAILRQHRDAFTSDDPTPLVPTLAHGVFANRFPTEGKEVWTLYNARHRTVRGELLRVPHRAGWGWQDAWHDRPLSVGRQGAFDVLSAGIGPHGVGCLVRSKTAQIGP